MAAEKSYFFLKCLFRQEEKVILKNSSPMTAKVQFPDFLRFQHLDPVPESRPGLLITTLSLEKSCLSNDQSYIPFVCLRGDDLIKPYLFLMHKKSVLGFLGSPFSYRQPSAAQSNHPLLDHLSLKRAAIPNIQRHRHNGF